MEAARLNASRVSEIDGLRFLCAVSVMLFHYTFSGFHGGVLTDFRYPWLEDMTRYGYLGVECFFMISGFVILMTATRVDLTGFAVSRFTRIFPALWICGSITFVLMLLLNDPRPLLHASWQTYAQSMLLVSGLMNADFIDGSYWSLVYELKFYLLVGCFVAIRRIDLFPRVLLAWLVVSALDLAFPRGRLAQWLMLDYSAFFIGGAVAYLIRAEGAPWQRLLFYAAAWVAALGQAVRRVDHQSRVHADAHFDPMVVALIVTVMFVLMLAIALRRGTGGESRTLLVLGAVTYPLYLLHQAIGFMLLNRFQGDVSPHLLLLAVAAAAIGGAYLVHRWLERPLARAVRARLTAALAR